MKHMKKTNQLTKRIMSLLLAIVLLIAGIRPITVHATTTMTVETINFKDFSNWRTGMYHYSTGKYCVWPTRVCLNDYVTVDGGEYRVSVKDSDYHLLIRELDKNKVFIKSNDLANGQLFKPSTNTAYLGISIYKTIYESSMSYDVYKTLFTKGFYAGLESTGSKETNADTPSDSSGNENNKTESDTTENNSTVIENKVFDVAKIDYQDFSNWRSGMYHYATGKHCVWSTRICLNDYVTIDGGEYRVCVKDSGYHLLIRELDKNKVFIKSNDLVNGQLYKPNTNTAYLGISIYKTIGESSMSYDAYKTLFAKGFYAGLEVVNSEETNTETPSESNDNNKTESDINDNNSAIIEDKVFDAAKIDYKDFSNWRTGMYHNTTGKYCVYPTRICLNDYVTVSGGEYKVYVQDAGYRLLIRELDKNKVFIKSYILGTGRSYTPSASAAYLGISIYKLSGESSVSYSTFKTLFANGFYAGLEVVEEEEEVEEEEDIILDNGADNDKSDETEATPKTFRDELKKMILSGDMTTHDISKYGMTYRQVDDTWEDLKKNECYIALNTYGAAFLSTTKNSSGIVQTIYIYNSDSDFANRYQRTCAAVDNFLAGVDSKMTNLDKIVYAHEYIVKNTTFRNSNNIDGCAGGVLGDKRGRCQGYSNAMRVLLHEMGINSYFISSSAMNHGWIMVELNGQYYHIDPTWDNTQRGTDNMYYHRFLMRNDDEFLTIKAARAHYDWYCSAKTGITSTSTSYSKWFVHDVAGCMYYYDGLWYYQDLESNSIVRSDVNGNQKSVVVDGSNTTNKIRLSGIASGVLKYTVNGSATTKNL